MKTRTLTALVMAVTMVPILIWGDRFHLFEAFLLIVSLMAAFEFRKMMRIERPLPVWVDVLTIAFTGLTYAAFVALHLWETAVILFPVLAATLFLVFGIVLVFVPDFHAQDFGNSLSTILYCSLGFASLAVLRSYGLPLIIYGLIVPMLNDMFAMWIGLKWGKHKLCPAVSPKKSVEGAIGGFVIGTALATAFAFGFNVFGDNFPWYGVLLMSMVLSCLGQIGDLVASKFKRSYHIKDYSNLFPGHGGILDRFDSWMFVALGLLLIWTHVLNLG